MLERLSKEELIERCRNLEETNQHVVIQLQNEKVKRKRMLDLYPCEKCEKEVRLIHKLGGSVCEGCGTILVQFWY